MISHARRSRRPLAVTVIAVGGLVAATACGSASARPTAKLPPLQAAAAGFSGLYAGNQITETITLDAEPATLQAVDAAGGSDPTPLAFYDLLTGGSIVIAATTSDASFTAQQAKGSAGLNDERFSLDVNAGDAPNLVQIVYAAKQLFARADVAKIESFGSLASPPEDLKTPVDQFLASPIARQLPFLADGVAGKWLKIDIGQVLSVLQSYDSSAVPSPSPSAISGLQQAIRGIVDKDVTAIRVGSDSVNGDHLVLTANARTISADAFAALKTYVTDISPDAADTLGKFTPSSVPDQDIAIEEYVKGGVVSKVTLPLVQFFSPAQQQAVDGQQVSVSIAFSQKATVTTPTSATTIDIPSLIAKFAALAASGSPGRRLTSVRRPQRSRRADCLF